MITSHAHVKVVKVHSEHKPLCIYSLGRPKHLLHSFFAPSLAVVTPCEDGV